MSSRFSGSRFVILFVLPVLAFVSLLWAIDGTSRAQCNNNNNNNNGNAFFGRQVGGVSINAEGVMARSTREDYSAARDALKGRTARTPDELSAPAQLRMISLRGLEAACREALDKKASLPEEALFLSGIQRIQYVFVYPEENDIVLAGPGEGWTFDEAGNVVGVTTGRPVLHLDDLLVALRYGQDAKGGAISCSIDPTAEGRRNLEVFLKKQRQFSPAVVAGMEKALGPQEITLSGVPAESHFARVMVAADFQMKRLAMKLEPAPVDGLPSFLDLLQTKRAKLDNMMPRWWLACNYEPLGRSEDGLSWELRGSGVKAMTEDDFIAEGEAKGSGRKSPIAQEWADNLTKKYGALSAEMPVFAELRNLMDLCVVAALIAKEDLAAKANCELPLLSGVVSPLAHAALSAPKSVPTQCSFVKAGKEYILTASGGVQIESFEVVKRTEIDSKLPKLRSGAAPIKTGKNWYWN